jgi:hypothetical protein
LVPLSPSEPGGKAAPPPASYRMAEAGSSAPPDLTPPPRGPARFGSGKPSRRRTGSDGSKDDRPNQINTWGIVMLVVGILMTLGGMGAMLFTFAPNLFVAGRTSTEVASQDFAKKSEGETQQKDSVQADAHRLESSRTESVSPRPEDTKAEDTKAEDTKAEDTKAEDTKAEDTKAEDTKAEDADDSRADDNTIKVPAAKAEHVNPIFWRRAVKPKSFRQLPDSIERFLESKELSLGSFMLEPLQRRALMDGEIQLGVKSTPSEAVQWFSNDPVNEGSLTAGLPLPNEAVLKVNLNAKGTNDGVDELSITISLIGTPPPEKDFRKIVIFVDSENKEVLRLPVFAIAPDFKEFRLKQDKPGIAIGREGDGISQFNVNEKLIKVINEDVLKQFNNLCLEPVLEDGCLRLEIRNAGSHGKSINYPFILFRIEEGMAPSTVEVSVSYFSNFITPSQYKLMNEATKDLGITVSSEGASLTFEQILRKDVVRLAGRDVKDFVNGLISAAALTRSGFVQLPVKIANSTLSVEVKNRYADSFLEGGFSDNAAFLGSFGIDGQADEISKNLSRFVVPIEFRGNNENRLILIKCEKWSEVEKGRVEAAVESVLFDLFQN